MASVVAVVFLSVGASVTIWRFEVALGHSDVALQARADALHAQQASTFFWRERETMNEYLLSPAPQLLSELEQGQRGFDQATKGLGAGQTVRSLVDLSRRADATFVATFDRNRSIAGHGSAPEQLAIKKLNASEAAVLGPLDAARQISLAEVRSRRIAKNHADFQALVAGLLAALIAVAATVALALYSRRLLGDMASRRVAEQARSALESEFTAMLQGTEAEEEADQLLKRQLERSIPASSVVVLRRNNSDDRLDSTTSPDPELARRLEDADPRSCLAIRFGRPHAEDSGHDPLLRCAICSRDRESSTCLPLLVGGEVIGSTLVRHPAPLGDTEQKALELAVSQAGPVLANLRNLALARFRAATDALTGLPNSRDVQDTLKRMCAHASRTLSPLTALILDLDHFKQINDTNGHAAGDDALAAFGTTVQSTLRSSDFVGRYGGEEFVVLLPDTGSTEGELVAEKIRAAVESISIAGIELPLTVSIGLATLPDHATDSATLLRSADRALYAAKSNGRNRVEISPLIADGDGGGPLASSAWPRQGTTN